MRKHHARRREMKKVGKQSPKDQGGQGIMPHQFSGKKPKVETMRTKKAREKRLERMAM